MKSWLVLILVLFALSPLSALDRQAFSFTNYQLDVQIDRASHVMAVTGRVSLRNGSKSPQKQVTLQICSSLEWNGIASGDEPLQWIGDKYTSDIDHTGSLSEAIATLPKAVPPGGSVTLDIQYGGTITPNATRLTRIGAPEDIALRNDWDEISEHFTAVRGLGFVVWYPVAIDAVSMSDGNAVAEAIALWKDRHQQTDFAAHIEVAPGSATQPLCVGTNPPTPSCAAQAQDASTRNPIARAAAADLHVTGLGEVVPAFAVAEYAPVVRPALSVFQTPQHKAIAQEYIVAAEGNGALLDKWLSDSKQAPTVIELTNPNANPYQNGSVLFTPLRQSNTATLQLLLIPPQVAARFQSPRPWVQNGVERFMQAMSLQNRAGRKAAIKFLDEYLEPLVKAEQESLPKPNAEGKLSPDVAAQNSLINTSDELYLHGKASFVFWMLRDMLGEDALQRTLNGYQPAGEKETSYLQRLLETNSRRDLEWFFDDWVYRDRGLPEFHVVAAYTRAFLNDTNKSFLVTVTLENRGRAGAEVPVLVETPSGTKTMRVLVKAGDQGTGRLDVPVAPDKLQVNDGSAPEARASDNTYNVAPPQS